MGHYITIGRKLPATRRAIPLRMTLAMSDVRFVWTWLFFSPKSEWFLTLNNKSFLTADDNSSRDWTLGHCRSYVAVMHIERAAQNFKFNDDVRGLWWTLGHRRWNINFDSGQERCCLLILRHWSNASFSLGYVDFNSML